MNTISNLDCIYRMANQATHWEFVTPYHEKRKVHFYVSRYGRFPLLLHKPV